MKQPYRSPTDRNARDRLSGLRRTFQSNPAADLKYMSYASEAVLLQAPGLHRMLLWGICVLVFLLLVWAYFAEIDEFTRGEGRVVPSSEVQVVQSATGRTVETTYDAFGRIASVSSPEGVLSYEYDSLGRMTREVIGTLADPQTDTRYAYDELGRLESVSVVEITLRFLADAYGFANSRCDDEQWPGCHEHRQVLGQD